MRVQTKRLGPSLWRFTVTSYFGVTESREFTDFSAAKEWAAEMMMKGADE